MTKNCLLLTILGIFIIYGCSQKAQQPEIENTFAGESFAYTNTYERVKCTESGGKAEEGICYCPTEHINDSNGMCINKDGTLGGDLGEALKGN